MFKSILKPQDPQGHVLAYEPRHIDVTVTEATLDFLKIQQDVHHADFKINDKLAEATGLGELERKHMSDQIESRVLEKLKDVQEKAYKEAFDLGKADGYKEAFEQTKEQIAKSISEIAMILSEFKEVKKRLLIENEQHIVKSIFQISKALALKEIRETPDIVAEVLKKALENAQADEQITVRLNPKDLSFINQVKEIAGSPLERISNLKLEPAENISQGGCIVETNYGVIDAAIETRITKLLAVLEAKMPKVNEDIS